MSIPFGRISQAANVDVEYRSPDVRLFFRIFLGVVFAIIPLVGAKCSEAKVKLQLLKGQPVAISQMVGWLTDLDSIFALFKLRALPGGWLGLLMIFTFFLFWANDLTTASLIQNTEIKGRCLFGAGLVVSQAPSDVHIASVQPPPSSQPATLVAKAQAISVANGGLAGVYKKANNDLKFKADPIDVLGYWKCEPQGERLDFPADTTNDSFVVDQARQNDLLYPYTEWPPPWRISIYRGSIDQHAGHWAHLVAIDSSVGNNYGTPFSVRVAVDMKGKTQSNKVIKAWACKTNNLALDGILSTIQSRSTFYQWIETFQGLLYHGVGTDAVKDPGLVIERLLNEMTMISGGDNFDLNESARREKQGCIKPATTIHWAVIFLTSLATVLLLSLLIYWMILLLLIEKAKNSNRGQDTLHKEIEHNTPGDIFGWIVEAARESERCRLDEMSDVKIEHHPHQWRFGPLANNFVERPKVNKSIGLYLKENGGGSQFLPESKLRSFNIPDTAPRANLANDSWFQDTYNHRLKSLPPTPDHVFRNYSRS